MSNTTPHPSGIAIYTRLNGSRGGAEPRRVCAQRGHRATMPAAIQHERQPEFPHNLRASAPPREQSSLSSTLDAPPEPRHQKPMRTISDTVSVRLYYLDDAADGGSAATLFYGPLGEAMTIARAQPGDIRAGLFIATENDVVAYEELEE